MSKKIKQVSYLSAIIISIGSTIGAGIFFKNSAIFANAGGSLTFMIASWVIAAIGILAVGLSLIEVSSVSDDDSGITGWVRKLAPERVAKYSIKYMLFVYLPLNYFALPLYAVMSLQDALMSYGVTFTGWEVVAIAFAFFTWLAFVGHFKFGTAEKMQWVFTILKFIPLAIIPFLAFANIGTDGGSGVVHGSANGLTGFSPWLGLMASIPAILFSVDGFYTITSLKSQMKEEKKMGSVIALSISIIMGFYLFFAIALGTDNAGYFGDISYIRDSKALQITINLIIMTAVFGIVNGFAMAIPKVYHSTHEEGHADIVGWITKRLKLKSKENGAFATSVIFTIMAFVILSPIAIYAWNCRNLDYFEYSASAANLFDLTDLIVNFTSLFIFSFVGIAIFGAIKNRQTNKVVVKKWKYFLPAAWITVIFLVIGTIYMFVESMVNMSGINGADQTTEIVKFLILAGTTIGTLIPTYWDKISLKLTRRKINKITKK